MPKDRMTQRPDRDTLTSGPPNVPPRRDARRRGVRPPDARRPAASHRLRLHPQPRPASRTSPRSASSWRAAAPRPASATPRSSTPRAGEGLPEERPRDGRVRGQHARPEHGRGDERHQRRPGAARERVGPERVHALGQRDRPSGARRGEPGADGVPRLHHRRPRRGADGRPLRDRGGRAAPSRARRLSKPSRGWGARSTSTRPRASGLAWRGRVSQASLATSPVTRSPFTRIPATEPPNLSSLWWPATPAPAPRSPKEGRPRGLDRRRTATAMRITEEI